MVSDNKTVEAINSLFIRDKIDQSTLNRFLTTSDYELQQLNQLRLDWLNNQPQNAPACVY